MRRSFWIACAVYLPVLSLLFWQMPTMTFAGAGSSAMMTLTFAQISGGAPATAANTFAEEAHPAQSPEPAESPAEAPVEDPAEVAPPEPEPEPLPEPEPASVPVPEPELGLEPVPEPELIPDPEPEPESVPEPKPEPIPDPEPKPEPVKKAVEKKSEPKAEKKVEKKAEKKIERKAEEKSRSKPQSKPVAKPKVDRPTATPDAQAVGSAQATAGPAAELPASVSATPGGPTASSQDGISTLVYGEVHDPFLSEVKAAVEASLRYPRRARMMRMTGTAVLQFIIGADGRLEELEIYRSSGQGLLDQTALKAVRTAEDDWSKPKRVVRVRFPIVFELKN